MTTLILIRHGESEANNMGIYAGHLDVDLHPNGLAQAKLTAQRIVSEYTVDKVYSSDLRRAFKTAQCVADLIGVEVIPERDLRENRAGEWEGVRFDELEKRFPEDHYMWIHDIGNHRCTGGESSRELGARVTAALERIARENDGKTVVIGTHATPIRAAQCLLSGRPIEDMKDIPWVTNASFSEYRYDAGKWSIVRVGEDAHLTELRSKLPPNA
ncbi:MAG: histidine phosphatase family protein [Clostridia bacterium]|nr:histidine phosphatase family protein [Clostridia bacterium]